VPSRFFRNVASVVFGNYVMIALSMVIGVVVARSLGTEGFGRLTLMLTAVQVASIFVFGWTLTGLVRFGAQEFSRTGSVSVTFWARMTLVAPLLAVVALGTALWRHETAAYLGISPWALWLVFAHFVLSQLLTTIGHVFQACDRMSRYAAVISLDRAVVLAAVLLLPQRHVGQAVAVLACYALGSLLILAWALASVGLTTLAPRWPGRSAVVELWRFSAPVLVSTGIGTFGGPALLIGVMKHFHPMGDLGVYSLASQIAGALQQLAVIVAVVLLPRLSVMVSRAQDDEIRSLVQQVLPYGLLGVSLVLGSCAIVAKAAIPLLFGADFGGAAGLLMVLIMSSMALTSVSLLLPFFNAYGLTWILSGISLTSAVVNALAALLLVPAHGALGAAIAGLCASAAGALVAVAAIRQRFRIAPARLLVVCTPGVAAALVGLLAEGAWAYVGAAAALVAGAYAVTVGLRLFGPRDLAALARVGVHLPAADGLARLFLRRTG
jgi:O-antigen/teichoic acid export membrane protein